MLAQIFTDLIADPVQRRKRAHRFLKDHRYISPAQRPHWRAVTPQLGHVNARGGFIFVMIEQNFTAAHTAIARQ